MLEIPLELDLSLSFGSDTSSVTLDKLFIIYKLSLSLLYNGINL